MSNDHKSTMKNYMEEVWNAGDLAAADKYIHGEFRAPKGPMGELPPGPNGIKQLVGMFKQAMPDLKYTIHDVISEGDKVVLRVSAKGEHKEHLFGHTVEDIKKHERPINGIIIARFKDGKIVEAWNQFDTISGNR